MSETSKHTWGQFTYPFLNMFRTVVPSEYVLVDEAINILGQRSNNIQNLAKSTRFDECGNLEPRVGEGSWQFLHPIATSIFSLGGPRFELTDQSSNGTSKCLPPDPAAVKFRDSSWQEVENLIANHQLDAHCHFSTGPNLSLFPFQIRQLVHQRELVRSTGCVWITNHSGMDRLVLLLINRKQLLDAIEHPTSPKKLKTKKQRRQAKIDAAAEEKASTQIATSDVLNFWIEEVLNYCQYAEVRISRDGMKYAVDDLVGLNQKAPNLKAISKLCDEFKPAGLRDALCKTRGSIIQKDGKGLEKFLIKFKVWRSENSKKHLGRN